MKHNNDTYFKINKLVGIKDSNPKDTKGGNNGMLVALILSCVFIYMPEFQMGNNKIYKKVFFN